MLKICLCDDDLQMLGKWTNKIEKWLNMNECIFRIQTFNSGEQLVFHMEEDPHQFDVIILDIIMGDLDGIEVAKKLRQYGYEGIILFLTSTKDYALDSFCAEPLNYILKEDGESQLEKSLLKAIKRIEKEKGDKLIIEGKPFNKMIDLDDILYIESVSKKTVLHKVNGEKEVTNCSLKTLYEKVEEKGFIRCHKSYIVNIQYFQGFNRSTCKLQNGEEVSIGRQYLKEFRSRILDELFSGITI